MLATYSNFYEACEKKNLSPRNPWIKEGKSLYQNYSNGFVKSHALKKKIAKCTFLP